jgi:hypothetical protein
MLLARNIPELGAQDIVTVLFNEPLLPDAVRVDFVFVSLGCTTICPDARTFLFNIS